MYSDRRGLEQTGVMQPRVKKPTATSEAKGARDRFSLEYMGGGGPLNIWPLDFWRPELRGNISVV